MRLFFLLFLSYFLSTSLSAQLNIPPASAPTQLTTQIGLTHFTLTYHRPGVKGRKIFGELLPYGEVWRAGANEATLLRFDHPIYLADSLVPAGTYALYTIPQEAAPWTVILSRDTTLWGARGYDQTKDQLRVDFAPSSLPERVESMEFRWLNLTHISADLTLEWENIRLTLPIRLSTHEQVEASIADHLNNSSPAIDYYRAARYYLDNNLDLPQAKRWMDRWFELNGEQFGIMRYQALLEYRLGNTDAATRIMERSKALAEEKGNDHYVGMNVRTLQEWDRTPYTDLTAQALLQRSITYHDPQGKWDTSSFEFSLHESRPGGGYRTTTLVLNNAADYFAMNQIRDRHRIFREYDNEGDCFSTLNGSADVSEEDASRFRLGCEAGLVYRNYYTYLWGLPMKLTDPGTILDPQVHKRHFFGQDLLEVKVTYTAEVGEDIWYFYFDPKTYALSGYRFYHDEAANDGEYILLEGEANINGIKLPAKRYWYTHGDRLYLGADEILNW